jgi:hypothetical protein
VDKAAVAAVKVAGTGAAGPQALAVETLTMILTTTYPSRIAVG